ncbi:MAG: PilZ domain-containing protein [Candidatus Omnitrophica bacterium]|nr:PilZ domain-containing protein [Candidatus Omnitrophota bacterium]
MTTERWQLVRIRSRLNAIVRFSSREEIIRALTRDIGVSGIRLLTEGPLASGELIGVELALPDRAQPIVFTGEVVWSKSIDGAVVGEDESAIENGIKFVTIDPKDREALMQWVALNALHPNLGDR